MKILVAIPSCHKFDVKWSVNGTSERRHGAVNERVQVVRETWARNLDIRSDIDFRIFYGYGAVRKMRTDEVLLSVDDSYRGLPFKVQRIFKWALERGYDAVLKVDDDTFISRDVIKGLGVDADYIGYSSDTAITLYSDWLTSDLKEKLLAFGQGYACGGMYYVHRRAMEILVRTKITEKSFQFLGINSLSDKNAPVPPCEDAWVGYTLFQAGIQVTHDPKYAGFTSDADVIKARLQPLFDASARGTLTDNDFRMYLALAPCLHFNVTADDMRRLYREENENLDRCHSLSQV